MKRFSFFLMCFVLAGLTGCNSRTPNVILETEAGNIQLEVYPEKAPLSARDFLYYIDNGLYDGQGFYRVVRGDNDPRGMGMSLIQGGRLDVRPLNQTIDHETTEMTGLTNVAGSLAIAREEPGTGSAAFFFINVDDNPFLDYGGERNPDGQGYAVFGRVTGGMDVVRAIQSGTTITKTSLPGTEGQFLEKPVKIIKAYRK